MAGWIEIQAGRMVLAAAMASLVLPMAGCASFPMIQPKPAPVIVEDLPPPLVAPPILPGASRDEKGNSTSLTALPRG